MQTRSARFWAITFLSGPRNTASASSRAPAPSTPMACATFRPWYRAAAAAITIRRHGCGRTAALSVRPAAARITRTARAPTASISAHCCWTMPKRMPLHRRQSRMPFRVWCGALPGWGQSHPAATATLPVWRCCLAKSGTGKRRCRTTKPADCWIPIRKPRWRTLAAAMCLSAPVLSGWNRS